MALLLSVLAVLLTSAGQLLLKVGTGKRPGASLLNRYVLAGYALFLITLLASYYLMHIMDLKYFTAVMSASYVSVAIASRIFLKESIDRRRAIGTMLVVAGVAVFVLF